MSRLKKRFQRLHKLHEKAVILFITGGDPSLRVTRQALRYADQVGVDCLEIGIPFSDPIADGPVIQAASHRALERGVRPMQILRLIRTERRRGLELPVVLMTSYNPIFKIGDERFLRLAKQHGVDGVIIPDLPLNESQSARHLAKRIGLDLILMETPTTEPKRKRAIQRRSTGFTYYVSLTGVTGVRQRRRYNFRSDVAQIKRMGPTPVCVGFGVSDTRQARDITRFADGVIIGSALVRHLHEHSRSQLSPSSRRFMQAFVKSVKRGKH